MSEAVQAIDFSKLTVSERIELVGAIWDSIPEDDESLDLTEDELKQLRKRLAEYRADPKSGLAWEDVRERLLAIRHSY